MLGKSTSTLSAWEEGKTSETMRENTHETSGNQVEQTQNATCNDESLLKACALRQEKLSLCHKNGAARNAHIAYTADFEVSRQEQIAGSADFYILAQQNALA